MKDPLDCHKRKSYHPPRTVQEWKKLASWKRMKKKLLNNRKNLCLLFFHFFSTTISHKRKWNFLLTTNKFVFHLLIFIFLTSCCCESFVVSLEQNEEISRRNQINLIKLFLRHKFSMFCWLLPSFCMLNAPKVVKNLLDSSPRNNEKFFTAKTSNKTLKIHNFTLFNNFPASPLHSTRASSSSSFSLYLKNHIKCVLPSEIHENKINESSIAHKNVVHHSAESIMAHLIMILPRSHRYLETSTSREAIKIVLKCSVRMWEAEEEEDERGLKEGNRKFSLHISHWQISQWNLKPNSLTQKKENRYPECNNWNWSVCKWKHSK